MNRIVIEFSPEDRKRLDELIAGVSLLAGVMGSALPKEARAEVIASATETHPIDAPTAHFDPPAPAQDPIAAAPAPAPVSLGEFQKALVTRCAEGPDVKQKVQALVHRYAGSVSEIPEDKRPEVLAALAEI